MLRKETWLGASVSLLLRALSSAPHLAPSANLRRQGHGPGAVQAGHDGQTGRDCDPGRRAHEVGEFVVLVRFDFFGRGHRRGRGLGRGPGHRRERGCWLGRQRGLGRRSRSVIWRWRWGWCSAGKESIHADVDQVLRVLARPPCIVVALPPRTRGPPTSERPMITGRIVERVVGKPSSGTYAATVRDRGQVGRVAREGGEASSPVGMGVAGHVAIPRGADMKRMRSLEVHHPGMKIRSAVESHVQNHALDADVPDGAVDVVHVDVRVARRWVGRDGTRNEGIVLPRYVVVRVREHPPPTVRRLVAVDAGGRAWVRGIGINGVEAVRGGAKVEVLAAGGGERPDGHFIPRQDEEAWKETAHSSQ